jgi:hypothetical protein
MFIVNQEHPPIGKVLQSTLETNSLSAGKTLTSLALPHCVGKRLCVLVKQGILVWLLRHFNKPRVRLLSDFFVYLLLKYEFWEELITPNCRYRYLTRLTPWPTLHLEANSRSASQDYIFYGT